MELGIVTLPLLPMRSESSDRSEMITQLLFGEVCEIVETKEHWCLVRNHQDHYLGWVTSKMLTPLSAELNDYLSRFPTRVCSEPMCVFRKLNDKKEKLFLPAGSRLFFTDATFQTAFFPKNTQDGYDLFEIEPMNRNRITPQQIVETPASQFIQIAKQFLNTPYLWGGKSVLGMDCSGLVQLAASILQVALPRDAKDQALCGKPILYSELLAGDLLFFCNNEGVVVHVGIVYAPSQVLHASGSVHLDIFDEKGIRSNDEFEYSHFLHSIRRIF